jgi:hypothetical protein
MMAFWNGKFYVHYISDVKHEHVPPSQTMLSVSKDGYKWTNPTILFPTYKVPDGFTKPKNSNIAKNLLAVMHQRVGFYVSHSNRLIAIGFYGVALDEKDDPNDGNGIGRVVREIKKDGTFGPIYFLRYNHGFNEKNTDYPFYKTSKDKGFVNACDEILDNPLYMMQCVEEADKDDPLLPLKKDYKAFSYYHLPDKRVVGLWKNALTSISDDGGKTWAEPVLRAKGFVNSNAKIWGQQLTDGMYATIYNPSEYRWPLAISLSENGLEYSTLNLVNGEVPPMRYGGNYKSYGPQYTRGIQEGNGIPPDSNLWVTYSMNKEDIWISRIPVPVKLNQTAHANDNLDSKKEISDLTEWNIYSPLWAPVSLENKQGKKWLTLKDKDPFDYAKIERVIPTTSELSVAFKFMAGQSSFGTCQIEFVDENSIVCSRLEFTPDGYLRIKKGARYSNLTSYDADKVYDLKAEISSTNRNITIYVDGKKVGISMLFAPVHSIKKIVFRTGEIRQFPTPETPADQDYDLPNAGEQEKEAIFRICDLKTSDIDNQQNSAILRYDDYKHYIDYFNRMEDENIVQAIPNEKANEWMKKNIPLFDCPQDNFVEMFYYRWWTLRKHIKATPLGYVMTEFLVNRTYADKYNMISCALGHHIYESRWLHDPQYLDQYIHAWYRGNDGKPMTKLRNYSSWTADALYNRFLVNNDKNFLLDMLPDLTQEYKNWENDHKLESGLYWQEDVKDGMEESISGGRKKKYARPSINSYMFGNAKALSKIYSMAGNKTLAEKYQSKSDSLRLLIEEHLWNNKHQFFETLRVDTFANVREAIGFIPWYFNLPDNSKFDNAWIQAKESDGFSAPYGLTTAERRHPLFRKAGCCNCEWDGAIWPFASSQTLTAMANFINNYPQQTLTDSVYFDAMERYVESQYHRGKPYIGEYLDETHGYWLKEDQERSRYYNHSTFNDLIITGLIGLRPRFDNTVEVNPLLPQNKWDWFCLDNILYHGKILTIVWDKTGGHYHQGKGFRILIDGKEVGKSEKMEKIICTNVL